MKITVIGTGYVGLVTGACLSDVGHTVTCLDRDANKLQKLAQGLLPIFEPGLEEKVRRGLENGNLKFETDLENGVREADLCMITVDTPTKSDGEADLSNLWSVVHALAPILPSHPDVIIRSTVPVGTVRQVREYLNSKGLGNVQLYFCPEFLREGCAIHDMHHMSRLVIGTENGSQDRAERVTSALTPLCPESIMHTSYESAELIKTVSNAFLATKISFMNEIANLCELTGADLAEVKQGIGSDPRIGLSHMQAGVGYGGSCLPKDSKALLRVAHNLGTNLRIVEAADAINKDRPYEIVRKIQDLLGHNAGTKTVGVLGISFKPNTSDVRNSPSLQIAKLLMNNRINVKMYDPKACFDESFDQMIAYSNPYEMAEGCQLLVVLTGWSEFNELDWGKLLRVVSAPLIFDAVGVLDGEEVRSSGWDYVKIGERIIREGRVHV